MKAVWTWVTLALGFSGMAAAGASGFQATKSGKTLTISAEFLEQVAEIEIRLASGRNVVVSKFSDVSPYRPKSADDLSKTPMQWYPLNREMWFPVVDIAIEPGMEAVASFDPVKNALFSVNGMFYPEKKLLTATIVIPGNRLEFWENSIWVESSASVLRSFFLRHRFHAAARQFRHAYQLLSEDWSGTVSLHSVGAAGASKELARSSVSGAVHVSPVARKQRGLDTGRLVQSLRASLDYTLRSQNRHSGSPTNGGLHLFYDVDASTYRSSHWIWGWGPSVRMLLDAARVPAITALIPAETLRRVAGEIGSASLRFIVEGGPADGVPISRWDRGLSFDHGYWEEITVSDANFLSGWAWIPLYEATGDRRYLEAAKRLAFATDRICREFDLPPQNYRRQTESWSEFTLDESGFGTEGLAELYRATRDPQFKEIGRRYMAQHLAKLQRPDGLWNRLWWRTRGIALPTTYATRALGWPMEGLLASHRMMPEGMYLDLATRFADQVIQGQNPAGYWTVQYDRPVEQVGYSAKGTALWCMLLYRLYRASGNPAHLEAAQKALLWLLDQQYTGPDPEAQGSLVECNSVAGVGYRPWFHLSCTYGSAFFGLAVLEELEIRRSLRG